MIGGNEDLFERVLAQARRRAGRGPADRLRGRVRRPARRRGGRRRPTRPPRRCGRRSTRAGARPFHGIRFKCFEAPTRARGVRTLALFLRGAAEGGSPEGFVVTLPKVTSVDQVEAMVLACERLEQRSAWRRSLRFEIQVETPQAVLGPDGTALVARMIHAAGGRCTGLHYGTYDYSASCGIAAAHQSLDHPAADHAKAVMQVAAAGTGVRLSDGSTNRLPGRRRRGRATPPGRYHPRLVRALARARVLPGLGPAPGAAADPVRRDVRVLPRRLRAGRARGCATTSGRPDSSVLDEPATARALADFLLRGLDCGALSSRGASRDRPGAARPRRLARRAPDANGG